MKNDNLPRTRLGMQKGSKSLKSSKMKGEGENEEMEKVKSKSAILDR